MAASVQQESTKTGGPWECSLAMPALEADPSHTPGVGRTQGQAFPTAPANGPASSCSCSTLLPLRSQWKFHGANPSQRLQLRVPPATSKNTNLPPVPWILPQRWVWRRAAGAGPWRSLPLPAAGLSWCQSMAGHRRGPRRSPVTASVATAAPSGREQPGAAGARAAAGCSVRDWARPPLILVETQSQSTTFPSLRRLPHAGLAGGQGPEPPPLFSSLGAGSQALPAVASPASSQSPSNREKAPRAGGGFDSPS